MPVIPVMDSQNVTDHFSKKFKIDEFKVAGFEQCVARLAVFIPDMRVLNSIANEFRLYRNLVNNGENIIQLLSLIAYKNLCARDYHLIDSKQGVLYGVINACVSGELITVVDERIKKNLNSLKTQIDEINEEVENDRLGIVRDILSVYFGDKTSHQVHFYNQYGTSFTLDQVINEENTFFTMLASPGLYVRSIRSGVNLANISSSEAEEIQTEYKRRCELLDSKFNGKLIDLEKRAEHLRQQKRRLLASRPQTLIERMGSKGFRAWVSEHIQIECVPDNSEGYTVAQFDFIYSLLRWGYLSTDYMSYRSVFIPGSLSSNDNDFVRAVSASKEYSITSEIPLDRTANVVKKLKELGLLLQDNAWHAGVLLNLLEHDRLQLKEIIQIQLEVGEEHRLEQLFNNVFSKWPSAKSIAYVHLMASDIKTTNEVMNRLLKMQDKKSAMKLLVILFCSSDLHWNYETTDMRYAAQNIFEEYEYIPDEIPAGYAESFTNNLKLTEVFLSRIGECKSELGGEIISLVARFKLWKYSKDNLINIVSVLCNHSSVVIEQFLKRPFSTIEKFNIPQLLEVINNNVNSFITDFFISSEEYSSVVTILNNEVASVDKLQILAREMAFLVDDISNVRERSGVFLSYRSLSAETSIYTVLLENNRIAPTWDNVDYLLNLSSDLAPWFAIWFDINHSKINDIPSALSSFELYSKLIHKIYASGALNEAARRTILSAIELTLLSLPDNLTVDEAALLVEHRRLAPVRSVYQQIYTAFHEEGIHAVPLLAGLVLQRPALLEKEPEFILINNGAFSPVLTIQLLTSNGLPDSILTSTLQWLWKYDAEIFDGPLFINASTLLQLLTLRRNESMLRALLVQLLRAGAITHDTIARVIRSFSDPVSGAFISDLNHRSIDLTENELELARLLESAGFIQSLNSEKKEGRYRFIPHNSPAFRRD